MNKRWISVGLGVLTLSFLGCQSTTMQDKPAEQTIVSDKALVSETATVTDKALVTDKAMITGKVMYRERIALPDTAILEVKLEDVSIADAAAEVIAEIDIPTNGKQVPLEFSLVYDEEDIKSNHRYGLRIKILNEGRLLFINDYHIGVVNDPKSTHDVEVILKGVR